MTFGVVVHGGAIPSFNQDYSEDLTFLEALAAHGRRKLELGGSALDVATEVMRELEGSARFIAGRGSSPNIDGKFALDACLIDGATGRSGCVAGLSGYKWPSQIARAILEHEREALWVCDGAERVAAKHRCDKIDDLALWFRPRFTSDDDGLAGFGYSTAGVVVLDKYGRLSAGTTTGGLLGKPVGRVGDSPIVGAGTWADNDVSVSCTGDGQAFYRSCASSYIASRQELLTEDLGVSVSNALARVERMGGSGAIIALSRTRGPVVAHNSEGVKFAMAMGEEEPISGLRSTDKP